MDDKKKVEHVKEEIVEEAAEVKDEKDQQIEELTDQLKRAVADYRNLERRNAEERMDAIRFANKQLIESLLPAFDTLFLAGKYTEDQSVKLTIGRIIEILKENGIEKVMVDDAKYNPETMEVVQVVEGKNDTVVEEVRPGFILNGKLIRPAQVKVGSEEKNTN